MDDLDVWLRFLLVVLAAWRVSSLLAYEDGPGHILLKVRHWLGGGFWGRLMDCFDCLSVWVAAPFSLFVAGKPVDIFVAWLAISGATCLLDRSLGKSVVFHATSTQDQNQDNEKMLRFTKGADENGPGRPPTAPS